MAPEVLSNNKYGEMSDVFSFGVVLTEVYSGVVPYAECSNLNAAQLLFRIVNERLRPSTVGFPRALAQLIDDCLSEEPKLRPSFDELVVRLPRLAYVSLMDTSAMDLRPSFTTTQSLSGMSLPEFQRNESGSSFSDYDDLISDESRNNSCQATTQSLDIGVPDDDDDYDNDGLGFVQTRNATLHSLNALEPMIHGTPTS
jgi:hypothetical protein